MPQFPAGGVGRGEHEGQSRAGWGGSIMTCRSSSNPFPKTTFPPAHV